MNLKENTAHFGVLSALFGMLAMFGWLIPVLGFVLSSSGIYCGMRDIGSDENGWPLAGLVLSVMAFLLTVIRSGMVYFYG